MSRRNLIVLFAGLAIGLVCCLRAEQNPYARYASQAYRLVDDLALEQPPDEELFSGAVRGMVAVLRSRGDEHSGYLEPTAAEPLRAEMRQQFGGIGVRVGLEGDPPVVTVVEPPQPGTPAYGSPILPRDVILRVDGTDTAGLGLQRVVAMMRGDAGVAVELAVRHADESEETFQIVREVIRVPSVIGDRREPDGGWRYLLEEEPRVALLRLTTFGNETVSELAATLDLAVERGAEAAIIDVRNNYGGALDAAVGACELLLHEGDVVVSTRGRGGKVLDEYRTRADGPFAELPLAVLIDGDTASAAEILAAALQDHDRAVVVGERSFGKGTVQQLLPLESGRSLLKLTAASYWRPSGENIHRLPGVAEDEAWGVRPDPGHEVPMTDTERQAWYQWRRQRDLLVAEGEADETARPLEADPGVAQAVQSLTEQLSPGG